VRRIPSCGRSLVTVTLILLLVGMSTLTFNVQPVKGSETIYIRANGSTDPSTAPISSDDNVTYTFTDNINDSIVVQRGNIIVDGAGYTLQGPGNGSGFDIGDINNVTIRNTNVANFYYGIYLLQSSFCNVSGNNIANNNFGVRLNLSSNGIISCNNMISNDYGIYLSSSSFCAISGNSITNNNHDGIRLYSSSFCAISGNSITNNDHGVYVYWYSHNSTISANTITSNNYRGVCLHHSSFSTISGNNITNNNSGVHIIESSSDTVSGNNITSNAYGVYASDSSTNKFYHNNFVSNAQQVYISSSGNPNFWDDDYPSGGNYWSNYIGVDIYSGPYQNETGSDGIGDTPYEIDADNIDHYPLRMPSAQYTLTITTSIGGTTNPAPGNYTYVADSSIQVTAIHDTYFLFDHWELNGSSVGSTSPYSVFMNASYTLHAVFFQINYTLTITTSAGGTTNPTPGQYQHAGGSNVSVSAIPDEYFLFDHWELNGSSVGSTSPYSVFMNASYTLHAVFFQINYTLTITTSAGGTTNPTPGQYQHAGGSNVSVSAIPDEYFLFDHWELNGVPVSTNPIIVFMDANRSLRAVFVAENRDVAVTNITLSRTVIGQGYGMSINVTAENQGDFEETFNVTLYANTAIVHILTVYNLTIGNSTTVTFTWNTTGFAKGNYTISATADTVPSETDTADNMLSAAMDVCVTIPGDVDGDRDVDIYDIVLMASIYGVSKPDPRYDPNCDIDNDGDIDIYDIVIAAGNYGESWQP